MVTFVGKEQWLGLDNIYAITNQKVKDMQLRIHMENFHRVEATAFYDNFYLKDRVSETSERILVYDFSP